MSRGGPLADCTSVGSQRLAGILPGRYDAHMRTHLVVFMAMATSGCGGSSREPVSGTADSSGVRIVVGPSTDAPLPWTMKTVATLRDETGQPISFTAATQRLVGADSLGRVFALSSDPSVLVFDSTGRLSHRLGRRGNGPGELQLPVGLTVRAGVVTVHDLVRRAMMRWSVSLTPLPDSVLTGDAASATAIVPVLGYSLVESVTPEPGFIVQRLQRSDGRQLALTKTATRDVVFSCVTLRGLGRLFDPMLIWSANASVTAFSREAGYVVDVQDSSGNRYSLRRQAEALAPTVSDVEDLFPGGMRVSTGAGPDCVVTAAELVERQGVAEAMPPIADLFVRSNGEVWVQRSGGASPRIDVFDDRGGYQGTLAMDGLPVAELPEGTLLIPVKSGPDQSVTLRRVMFARR